MTFKVDNYYNNYKISIGDRKRYVAKNLDEVITAMKHYYSKPHDKNSCIFCKED